MEPEKVRAPNIRDVARLAGVSYQTVSRVLNDSPSIKPSTRQRVLDVINDVGYRPNQAARALVTSRSRTIGVLSGQTTHYGPATSIHAIEGAAREAGYRLSSTSIASGDYASIRSALDYLLSQSLEALVVLAPQVRVFEAIEELSIAVPFVTLESSGRETGHSLSVDQVAGARMATRHLIELGHTEIVHLSGPKDWIEADARMQGFLEELGAANLRTRAPILGDWTAHFGYYAGLELLRFRDFTAVFCGNDQMALGFTHACRDMGLDVPGDISIVGFDDIPEAAHFSPPLTTVRQNFAELGRRAVAQLLSELGGEAPRGQEQITPELVVRSSTARVATPAVAGRLRR
ncbi:LacI family transcriptional regulator [Glaciihabitans tibetensis]|uniref:LacI family transcriptional regulator n=2 Tax=Glaciihabitans tibetensis TaxID=1266600 RepID=A0A2T0V712_9MICO|nr:LacI family transcriptional regulator [Glaciihabitans tibetensis]